ncbi:hypothetical protein ACPPVO_35510 [Dactylosporangium sp. McL0621]|uniref:hypothetical protein n=1 Tax=Dactylosporangium sp. McL0621 TaxID=3415678 RepID=UPI003CF8F5CA
MTTHVSPAEAQAALSDAFAAMDRAVAKERERTGTDGALTDKERDAWDDRAEQLVQEALTSRTKTRSRARCRRRRRSRAMRRSC